MHYGASVVTCIEMRCSIQNVIIPKSIATEWRKQIKGIHFWKSNFFGAESKWEAIRTGFTVCELLVYCSIAIDELNLPPMAKPENDHKLLTITRERRT